MTARSGSDRGTAALEFAVIVPALGLLAALLIGAGRIWHAHTIVEQIAGTAARAASQSTTPGQARAAAERIADAQASTRGLNCSGLRVAVDLDGFRMPVGQPAQIGVRVDCTVGLADLMVPGWPGTWHLGAEGVSVLDRYRRRG